MNIKKILLGTAMVASLIAVSVSAQAARPESSLLMNELSTYDAIFLQNVSDYMAKKIKIDIVKTDIFEAKRLEENRELYHDFNNDLMKLGDVDSAAQVHINNISGKAIKAGYEITFTKLKKI